MAMRSTLSLIAMMCLAGSIALADVCSRQIARWGGFGDISTVALADDYLFFGGSVLRIADISQPHAPTTVGSLDLRTVLDSSIGIDDIAVADGLAVIGLETDGLAFVDVEDPTQPQLLSTFHRNRPDWSVRAVGITPPIAIVASSNNLDRSRSRVARIDLADSSNPVEIDGIDLFGEVQDLTTDGRYAFVITSSYSISGGTGAAPAMLHIIDLIRWDGLDVVGSIEFPGAEPIAVDATPGLAVLLDWHGGVHLVDTIDVQHPVQTDFVDTGASGWGSIVVSHGAAFIASSGGLHVVSFNAFGSPTVTAAIQDIGYEPGIAAIGGWVYPAAGVHGLQIIDLNDRNNPISVGFTGFPHHADDVAIGGGKAVVIDSSYDPFGPATSVFRILSLQPQGPVSSFETAFPPGPVNGIAMHRTDFFMSVDVGSISPRCVLRTIDLAVPLQLGNPEEIPLCPFKSESGIQIDFEADLLAVLDAGRTAVHLVDLGVATGPTEIGSWPVRHECTAIALFGNKLFTGSLAGGSAEVEIIDVSNPGSPTFEEIVQLDGGAIIDMAVVEGTLAVATFSRPGKAGAVDLHLIDPATATVRSRIRGVSQTAALRLEADERILYLRRSNAAESELLFVDLEARWPSLRELPMSGAPGAHFDVSGDQVAWAGGSAGLLLTSVNHCVTPVRDADDSGRAGYTP